MKTIFALTVEGAQKSRAVFVKLRKEIAQWERQLTALIGPIGVSCKEDMEDLRDVIVGGHFNTLVGHGNCSSFRGLVLPEKTEFAIIHPFNVEG